MSVDGSSASMNPSSTYDSDSSLTSTQYCDLPCSGDLPRLRKSNHSVIVNSLEMLGARMNSLDDKRKNLHEAFRKESSEVVLEDVTPDSFLRENEELAQELRLAELRCNHLKKQLKYIRTVLKVLYSDSREVFSETDISQSKRLQDGKGEISRCIGAGDFVSAQPVENHQDVSPDAEINPKPDVNENVRPNYDAYTQERISPAIALSQPKQICLANDVYSDQKLLVDYQKLRNTERIGKSHSRKQKSDLTEPQPNHVKSSLKKLEFDFKDLAKKCDNIITNLATLKPPAVPVRNKIQVQLSYGIISNLYNINFYIVLFYSFPGKESANQNIPERRRSCTNRHDSPKQRRKSSRQREGEIEPHQTTFQHASLDDKEKLSRDLNERRLALGIICDESFGR